MTSPDDLRRQVLAAVERVRGHFPEAMGARLGPTYRTPAGYSTFRQQQGFDAALDAILAEFGLNPDGTFMKEPPA